MRIYSQMSRLAMIIAYEINRVKGDFVQCETRSQCPFSSLPICQRMFCSIVLPKKEVFPNVKKRLERLGDCVSAMVSHVCWGQIEDGCYAVKQVVPICLCTLFCDVIVCRMGSRRGIT